MLFQQCQETSIRRKSDRAKWRLIAQPSMAHAGEDGLLLHIPNQEIETCNGQLIALWTESHTSPLIPFIEGIQELTRFPVPNLGIGIGGGCDQRIGWMKGYAFHAEIFYALIFICA